MVKLKRAYDPPTDDDGARVLVDRLWPRGVSKEKLALTRWAKELAPSTELRRAFCHDPERWDTFRARYREELAGHAEALEELVRLARKGTLTLVYAAKDEKYNQAVVLRDVIEECAERN